MRKGLFLLVLSIVSTMAFAQFQPSPQWTSITSNSPETFQTQLISSTENSIKVNVQVPGFYTTTVTTPRGEAHVITVPKSVSTAKAGEPDMPMTGIPLMIGDKARMNVRVIDAQYQDFEGIEVAPSKGDFSRQIDPATVPYTYGECYGKDAFFPEKNLTMYEPYIIRDFRGQNMAVFPFAYNPVTKTLRVYYNMTVEMYKVDNKGENIIESRRSNEIKMDPDFKSVYQRHFLNYEAGTAKYTALDEEGDLLIICYDNYINYMTDFVNWKKTRGINTTIVGTSTAGSSYSAIQTYIQNQYNANNNLTHVLLVGDVAQIPGYSYSGGGSSYGGKGDNAYGQVVGSDIYNDVFIGRFSASSTSRVTTQANRVITYERDLGTSATWLGVAEGISRKEGGSGHNSEDDYQHMNNIRTDLLNYGYNPVYQRYANLTGYDGSSSTISSDINSGVGIINYTNHGQETAWGANSSGYIYYSNSHVNALTNDNKLPFIWSVACLVGKYDYSSGDCFAEAWMNATNGSNPTGAIGTLMSYISQPWIPPMWAQDECVDILVDSYSNNIKHTWGGTSVNGLMGIFDHYSTSEQQAVGTYQAWILFGDPSMMLRTKTPTAMTVTHNGTIAPSATSYAVTVSNGSGAVATITDASHNILGKATVSGTSVTIPISGTLTAGTELTLCVFGFNKVTYLGTISVQGGTQYTVSATASPTNGGTVSGAGQYYENTSCTLTATPNTGYTFTNWKKGNSVVSTNATYTFNVTSSTAGEYTATFTAIPQYTISVTANPTNGGTVSGGGTFYEGTSCTLTATPATGYTFTNWKKGNSVVSTNATYTFNVTEAATFTATFTAIPQYTITAQANPTAGGTVSGGGTFYQNTSCTLTATANTGYAFTNWTKNGTQVSANATYTFTVTAAGTYVANFDQLAIHSVTCSTVEGGTISASASTGYPGDVITLTATASNGYFFSAWDVRDANNNPITVSNNQFTMPNSDVTVSATFVQGCNVTVVETEHGTVTASATFAVPGTTITLTATPETGYYLGRWIVFKTGDVREEITVTGNSFELPAYDVTVVGIFKMTQEAEIAIGQGSTTNSNLPTNAYYKYSLTQQIYTAAEVGAAGTITKIAFKVANSKSTTRTLDVYLKTTSKTAFTSNTGWETMSSSDKVYSGSVTFLASGWTTITLSTPFEYDGTSNLIVCVDDNTGSYVSSSSNSPTFYVYSTSQNRAMRYYNDSTNPSATSPSTVSGSYVTSNNQITFTMTTAGSEASLTVSPNVLNDFTYVEGNGPSMVKSLAVIGVDLIEDINVTAPEHFEISDEEGGTYGSTLTFTAESKGNRGTFTYDFEDGTQGWTVLQGTEGNSPNNWHHNTTHVSYSSGTAHDWSSFGHNSSSGFMMSESYISATSSNGTAYGAVTPDNYLISPQVTLGGSISFYAGARNTSYCAEQFSVMVSTTDNTNTASFTTVETWILTLDAVGYSSTAYSADLSAYAGQTGYIAIRHWGCNDQWVLCVDDITIVEGENTPVIPDPEPTVEFLTANVYVRLKAGLNPGTYANETLSVTTSDITSNVTLNGEVTEGDHTNYYITVTASPAEGGSVTGSGSHAEDSELTLTATPAEGYTFANWTKDGQVVSDLTSYTFTVTEDATYVANFTINTYTITALVNPENAGTVTGAGTYNHGDGVILIATANEGYDFVNWTENGTVVCNNTTCTSTATADRTLVANFVLAPVEQTVTLNEGWNWWSTYLDITVEQLEEALGDAGFTINAVDNAVDMYESGLGWAGSLTTIDPAYMYQIEMTNALEVVLSGLPLNPEEHTITINPGINWIGYPVQHAMTVTQAMANYSPVKNDVVKSKSGSSIYSGTRWSSDWNLEPGVGYMYVSRASSTGSFTYPNNRGTVTETTQIDTYWTAERDRFANNMTVVATLDLGDAIQSSDDVEVGAFVNGECRDAVKLVYLEELGQHFAILTVSGENGENVSFKALRNGSVIDLDETITVHLNDVLGDLDQPVVLHASTDALTLFPNPANKGEQVQMNLPASFDANGATVEVFNALGARVNAQVLNQNSKELQSLTSPGVYTIKVTDLRGNVLYGKLVVR